MAIVLFGVAALVAGVPLTTPRTATVAAPLHCTPCEPASVDPERSAVTATVQAISPTGVEFIANLEGFTATPQWDQRRWSVGHGGRSDDPHATVSAAGASEALRREATRLSERIVAASRFPLQQHQVDALTSFAYNVGESALFGYGRRAPSTLWASVQAGDFAVAAGEFCKWNRAGGRVLRGLVHRREEEAALFRGDRPGAFSAAGATPARESATDRRSAATSR